jgi:hypothetical protein
VDASLGFVPVDPVVEELELGFSREVQDGEREKNGAGCENQTDLESARSQAHRRLFPAIEIMEFN